MYGVIMFSELDDDPMQNDLLRVIQIIDLSLFNHIIYRVFIEYCAFLKILKKFMESGLS